MVFLLVCLFLLFFWGGGMVSQIDSFRFKMAAMVAMA